MPIWDGLIPPEDLQVYAASGYGARGGLGDRPAVLVIDVTYNFAGDQPEPILESIKRFPTSCGERAWQSIAAMEQLLAAARQRQVPILYTAPEHRKTALDAGRWLGKMSRSLEQGLGNEIVAPLAPQPGDVVIRKQKPSGFFGTPLASYLVALKVDTLLVCGGTTSGCVRATALDGFSYNYAVAAVEEATFDRSELVHRINLFDIQSKYGDVLSLQDTLAYLDGLGSGNRPAVGSATSRRAASRSVDRRTANGD